MLKKCGFEVLEHRELLDAKAELVADLDATSSMTNPSVWHQDALYFAGDDGTGDVELWKSDGTTSGTGRVIDLVDGGSSFPKNLVSQEDGLYFLAYQPEVGWEWWKTDGTEAGTRSVDFDLGESDPQTPNSTIEFGEGVIQYSQLLPPTAGEPVRTRLTLTDLSTYVREVEVPGRVRETAVVGHVLYLHLSQITTTNSGNTFSVSGPDQLWAVSHDFMPVRIEGVPAVRPDRYQFDRLHATGTAVYLVGEDSQLWQLGSSGGVGPVDTNHLDIQRVVEVFAKSENETIAWVDGGGKHLLIRIDNVTRSATIVEGTPQRPSLGALSNFHFTGSITPINERLAVLASVRTNHSYWDTPISLVSVNPSSDEQPRSILSSLSLYQPQVVDGQLFAFADDQIWMTDGFATVARVSSDRQEWITQLSVVGGNVYFDNDEYELWKFNVEAQETTLLVEDMELFSANGSFAPSLFHRHRHYGRPAELGEHVYFLAFGDDLGLWRDGQESSPEQIATLSDDVESPTDVPTLLNGGDKLFLVSDSEIWVSDGTALGTRAIPDSTPISPMAADVFGDHLLFVDDDGSILITDGNEIVEVAESTNIVRHQHLEFIYHYFSIAGSNAYYVSRNGPTNELWKTDGTKDGTVRLFPGNVGNLSVSGDRLYFAAHNEEFGSELWTTDGTLQGTVRLTDVNPGSEGSFPHGAIEVGDYLYFAATDGFHGTELHRLPLDAIPTIPAGGDANRDGSVSFEDFLILSSNFAKEVDAVWEDGDFDADGQVSFADFLILSANFGIER